MTSRWATLPTIGLAMLTSLILLLPLQGTRAQAGTTVFVEPAASSLPPGESTTLALAINDASKAYGFEVQIRFDPGVLQVIDQDAGKAGIQVAAGDFFNAGEGFVVANEADNETGEIYYAFTLLAPASPREGAGQLLFCHFQAVAPGQSQVAIASAILASPEGQPLPVTTQGGRITVIAEGENTPTPSTPIPSATSTPSPSATSSPATATPSTPSPTPTATPDGAGPTPTATPVTATGTPGEVLPTSSPLPITATPTSQGTGPTATPQVAPTESSTPSLPSPTDPSSRAPSATAIEQAAALSTPAPTRTRLAVPTAPPDAGPDDGQAQPGSQAGWLGAILLFVLLVAGLTTGYFLRRRNHQDQE